MMPVMAPMDKIRSRTVANQINRIQEHLEAMRRDAHGLEYAPWKREVDDLWKRTFGQINQMNPEPQKTALEAIKELWVSYISHYGVMDEA